MTHRTRADSPTKVCTHDGCDRALRARGFCSTHYNKIVIGEARRHPVAIVNCAVCNQPVLRRLGKGYAPTCSIACRSTVQWGQRIAQVSAYQWRGDAKSRARKHGATIIEDFDRVEIFERDDWMCQLCGIKCSEPDPYTLTAATVDHIVAYANGGQHTRANAQTACLSCNSTKRDGTTSQAA